MLQLLTTLYGFTFLIDVDECAEGESGCQYKCHNKNGSYDCECLKGTTLGADLKTCDDIDECIVGINNNINNNNSLTQPCDQNAICTNYFSTYVCRCEQGFSGNGRSCADIDECDQGTRQQYGITTSCNQNCTNTDGSYMCSCKPGFKLSTDLHTCVPNPNLCFVAGGNPCDASNSVCQFDAVSNKATCRCKSGFTNFNETKCEGE